MMRWLALALLLLAGPAAAQIRDVYVVFDDLGVDKVAAFDTGERAPNSDAPWDTHPPTPNWDALAALGVNFHDFISQTSCSPTRGTLYTGLNTTRRGTVHMEEELAHSLPRLLVAAGWKAEGIGKYHCQPEPAEFRETEHPLRAGWQRWEGTFSGAAPSYTDFMWCVDGNCVKRTGHATVAVTDAAIERMNALEASGSNFLLVVAYNAPHAPYECPQPPLVHSYGADCGGPFVNYYEAMIEAADHEFGRLVAAVDDWAKTRMYVMGDNGTVPSSVDAPFDPGHGKLSLYYDAHHVPLTVRGRGVTTTGIVPALAQIADIPATTLADAGLSARYAYDGIALTPYLSNVSATPLRTISVVCYDHTAVDCAAKDAQYHLLRLSSGATIEMYDLLNDRFEANALNLGSLTGPQQAAHDKLLAEITTNQTAAQRRTRKQTVP